MAATLSKLWKRFNITIPKERTVVTSNHDSKESKGLGERIKCLFLGHATSTEVRMERNRHGEKKHYRYCYKCGKKWYID